MSQVRNAINFYLARASFHLLFNQNYLGDTRIKRTFLLAKMSLNLAENFLVQNAVKLNRKFFPMPALTVKTLKNARVDSFKKLFLHKLNV